MPDEKSGTLGNILNVMSLLNTAIPAVESLIVMIKRKDGGVSVISLLDEADAGVDANLDQIYEWRKANPKP
jgi:hypothetical protein